MNTLNSLLIELPPEIDNFRRDKLLLLLSLINEAPVYNKRRGANKNGLSYLSSVFLRAYVHNYNEYLNYLIDNGIIETDNYYIPGKKSRGYKIADKYNGKVSLSLVYSPSLVKKIRKEQQKWQKLPVKYNALFRSFSGLEIDYDAAMLFISDLYSYRTRNPENREWNPKKKRFKIPTAQYNSAYININYLKDKKFYFFVDSNVHRLHSNITNIQSDLRNFLSWKGEKLVSIDISNSQPYLSCMLFSQSFYTSDNALNSNKKENKLTIFSFPGILDQLQSKRLAAPSFVHHITDQLHQFGISEPLLAKDRPSSVSLTPVRKRDFKNDIEWFVYLVANGSLYEYLEKMFCERLGESYGDRKSVKAAVFQVLFTDNRFYGQDEAAPKRIFKEIFPQVYKLFSLYKRRDASLFPRLLQQIESRLIIDVICARILKERPEVPLITIHDSIATTIPNLEYVKSVMHEELTKHIGIEPNFKCEYWNKDNVVAKYPEIYPSERVKLQA